MWDVTIYIHTLLEALKYINVNKNDYLHQNERISYIQQFELICTKSFYLIFLLNH